MRLLNVIGAAAVCVGAAGAAAEADAAERLTLAGAALPAVAFAPGGAVETRVDVAGEEVLSVHAVLNPASSTTYWMRDRDGFWADWSGNMDELVESAAKRDGDELVFKIFDSPPAGVGAMTISIAYRTPEGLKFGWFEAAERAE